MGKNKYVSYKTLRLKNDKGDNVVIHEQNHYNEWAYTIMSVNGKEVSTGGCWDYLSSALKESEKYGNTKKDI
jgi:hypothetical protein